jgi:hypothetical protein
METGLIKVVKGRHDVLGINVHSKSDLFDFVILFYDEFVIHYIGKDGEEQTYSAGNNINNIHITYHSSEINKNSIKNPELHLKKGRNVLNVFDKITDINMDTEFPIPLFKMTCKDIAEELKEKSTVNKCSVIDLDDYGGNPREYKLTKKDINTIEIYFASRSYIDHPRHEEKWPILSSLQMMSPIDYVVRGVDMRGDIIDDFAKGNIVLAQEGQIYDQCVLLVKKYYDKNINDNSIYFYENISYIDMLATTPICLTTENGEQNRHYLLLYCSPFTAAYCDPFSGIFPAFCYELDMQLQNNISFEEVNRWHNIFRNSLENIKKNNIKRKGFIIPQT